MNNTRQLFLNVFMMMILAQIGYELPASAKTQKKHITLDCLAEYDPLIDYTQESGGQGGSITFPGFDGLRRYCFNQDDAPYYRTDKPYVVEILGLGLGLRSAREHFYISCSYKTEIEGSYFGAKLAFILPGIVGMGVETGEYFGKNGRCNVSAYGSVISTDGPSFGLPVNVAPVSRLTIARPKSDPAWR